MSHPPIARSFVFVLVSLMAGVIPARGETPPAQTPPAQSSAPVLCGGAKEVSIVIDPGADTGSAQIEFCNPPNSNAATSPVTISAKQFTSRMTRMPLAGRWAFSQDKNAGTDSLRLDAIPVKDVRIVKVEISQIWEAGEAEAPLNINGTEVAKLVARKYRLPFGVKIDGPNPDQPELTLERGHPLEVVLKNSDGVTYVVDSEFRIAGVSEKQTSMIVGPNGSVRMTLNANSPYFSGWPGLLRDRDESAYLTLSFRPPGVPNPTFWPSKVITVKAHLRSLSEDWRLTFINPLLIIVLFAGAWASYVGSVSLPNRVKRSERNERLSRIAQRLSSISNAVDSRLRVAMRVQRKRLVDLLHSRKSISADLVNMFSQVDDGATLLERQIALAERIEAIHRRLKFLDDRGTTPSLLESVEEVVWKAADEISQVCPDDGKLQRSANYLDDAESLVKDAELPTQDQANKAAAALAAAQDRLRRYVPNEVYAKVIDPAFPGLVPPVSSVIAQPAVADTPKLDRDAIRCARLTEFIELYIATRDKDMRAKLDLQLNRLMRELALGSYQAVRRAKLLVREAQEGIYPEDLSRTSAAPEIRMDPTSPRPNDPIAFSVRFTDSRLNDCAARLEYEGRWSFGHDESSESGWDLVHYFPAKGAYHVRFEAVSSVEGQRFEVPKEAVAQSKPDWWKHDRNRAEVLRFVITLVPAIIGLLSGAREQFLKMDPWAATFAVFMLGFGSDTVKNLVSQTQPAPAKPAPAQTPSAPPATAPSSAPAGQAGATKTVTT